MEMNEWQERILAAYKQAPRTYQDAYKAFLTGWNNEPPADSAASFHSGWLMACDALANRLVEWLDAPAGDDVAAFLSFIADLRGGDLTSDVENR